VHEDKGGQVLDYTFTCVSADQLQPPERPFICTPQNRSGTVSKVECCQDRPFCNFGPTPKSAPPKEPSASPERHWYLLLLFGVAVVFSAVGLSVGIYCERPKRCFQNRLGRLVSVSIGLIRRAPAYDRDTSRTRLDKLLDDLEVETISSFSSSVP